MFKPQGKKENHKDFLLTESWKKYSDLLKNLHRNFIQVVQYPASRSAQSQILQKGP